MNTTPRLKRQIVVLALSLLVSVLAAALPDWASISFTTADQVVLGVLLFLVFVTLDIYLLTNDIVSRERREAQLWAVRTPLEQLLMGIRTAFEQLIRSSYGDRDLFVNHFMGEVRDLDGSLRDVAQKGELRVRADHFLSVDNVLNVFRGSANRIWRYTWFIDPSDQLFADLAWRRYFERTSVMLQAKEIAEIRIVLVFSEQSLVNSPRVGALLKYFASHRGFDCWYMLKEDYAAISADMQVPASYLDFGIYSDRLLFLTEQYAPEIIGIFSKDKDRIAQYTHLFDALWGSAAVATKNPAEAKPVLTLEELLAADGAVDATSQENCHHD